MLLEKGSWLKSIWLSRWSLAPPVLLVLYLILIPLFLLLTRPSLEVVQPCAPIVRTCDDGYEFAELVEAIARNGEGRIVTEPDRTDDRLDAMARDYSVASLRMNLGD